MLKLALLVSVAGLVLLASLAYFIAPAHIELSELESYNGKTVVVRGEVTAASYHSTVAFLEIDENPAKIVLFDALDYKFAKGALIEVQGDITRYKKKLEIIAEEIKCLKC